MPTKDTTGHRRVSTKVSLFDLWAAADRRGLFCNFTAEPNTGCHLCHQPSCIWPEHLIALTPEQHRRVHTGLGLAWNVFKERVRVDPFDRGFIGLPFRPMTFDLAPAQTGGRP